MATKSKQSGPTTRELRESLEEDVKAFLASGKKITQIPNGVSGVDSSKGTKNIALGQAQKR
ncbi:MAG: hypothetical protein CMQ33_08915 [Gammaproteobacteria bacterium]|jgi:hypothetical protein|nr:hypothetical protein [Gammaproteobacteria bacterium]|tara:strand:+ start:526 stop:708 length:183 start_codon:yes stop_codon:yes gene_type:complete